MAELIAMLRQPRPKDILSNVQIGDVYSPELLGIDGFHPFTIVGYDRKEYCLILHCLHHDDNCIKDMDLSTLSMLKALIEYHKTKQGTGDVIWQNL